MRVRLFLVAWLSVIFTALIIQNINPFGLDQRLEWGMKPPYHWVNVDTSKNTPGSFREVYVDSQGKVCGDLYHYASSMEVVRVYGFGYSEDRMTVDDAKKVAEKECR